MYLNEPIIVCSSDDKFSPGLLVMLKSLSLNTTLKKVYVYIIDVGLSEEVKLKINQFFLQSNLLITFCNIENITMPEFKTSQIITLAAYYRIFIPQLLPSYIEKAIYLDIDIVVVSDIKELWELNMNDKALSAVPETSKFSQYVSSTLGLRLYKQLNIPKHQRYFNSGVMCLNLKKWRENGIAEKIVHYLVQNKRYVIFHDQDGLNAILWNDWQPLPQEWNVTTELYECKSWEDSIFDEEKFNYILSNEKIIHYTKKRKPWYEGSTHPKQDIFDQYLSMLFNH